MQFDDGKEIHSVLFVTDSLRNGGAERQLSLVVKNLPPHWSPRLWSFLSGPWESDLRTAGIDITVRERSWRFDLRPGIALWREMRYRRPDLVYAQGWMAILAVLLPCALLRIPLVDVRMRGASINRHNWYRAKFGLRVSDIVVANSRAGLSLLHVDSSRGRVIRNGFDWSRVSRRLTPVFSTTPYTAVMSARMSNMKDWDSFVGAARRMETDYPKRWRFLALGNGPDLGRLRTMGQDLVESGVMEIVSDVEDVMPTLAESDVGILLTNPKRAAEGCSNSILEYMATGLPVIAYDTGGTPELVKDGVMGHLIRPGDVEGLSGALELLAADPAHSQAMGQRGADRVRIDYSVDRLVGNTVAAFEDALRSKSRGKDRTWVSRSQP